MQNNWDRIFGNKTEEKAEEVIEPKEEKKTDTFLGTNDLMDT